MRSWTRTLAVAAAFTAASAAFPALAEEAAAPAPDLVFLAPTEGAAAPADAAASLAGPEPIEQQFWQEEYGDCHLSCGPNHEPYIYSGVRLEECCGAFLLCGDGSYPTSKYWSPYYGWPQMCMD